jgi:hypothetical protein
VGTCPIHQLRYWLQTEKLTLLGGITWTMLLLPACCSNSINGRTWTSSSCESGNDSMTSQYMVLVLERGLDDHQARRCLCLVTYIEAC